MKRKELRLNHPGLGALSFEMLLEVVSEQVIGWNMREHCATDQIGLFGKCEGVAAAMDEQGRRTVHVHFSIWIKGFAELRNELFFGTQEEKRSATLENLAPREFFEEYNVTVIRKDPKDGEPDLRFISDTGFFKHPSAKKTRKR